MFKVAAVCIDTSPEPLPESKDGFVDLRLRKISPDAFQHRLEFHLVSGLGLMDPITLSACENLAILNLNSIHSLGLKHALRSLPRINRAA